MFGSFAEPFNYAQDQLFLCFSHHLLNNPHTALGHYDPACTRKLLLSSLSTHKILSESVHNFWVVYNLGKSMVFQIQDTVSQVKYLVPCCKYCCWPTKILLKSADSFLSYCIPLTDRQTKPDHKTSCTLSEVNCCSGDMHFDRLNCAHFWHKFCSFVFAGFPRRPLPGSYSNWCCSAWTWHSRGWSCHPVCTSKGKCLWHIILRLECEHCYMVY